MAETPDETTKPAAETFTVSPFSVAKNVSFKMDLELETPIAIIRSLNSHFCNVVTVKPKGELVQMDFGHADMVVNRQFITEEEERVKLHDYEFEPSASIMIPRESLHELYDKLKVILGKE